MTSEELLAGRRVVLSVSGGKDSAATSLLLHERGVEHDRVFFDTGWEHEATYEYLRGPLTAKIGPIVEIGATEKMEELIARRGMFPSRVRRFCTQQLKVIPAIKYMRDRMDSEGIEVVNTVGIRRAESRAREKLDEIEWSDDFDCYAWRPIIEWSEQDVIDIHKRHGLAPNPLYLLGARRVGCWPCIMTSKAELALIARVDPGRIERIRALESSVSESARARYDRDRAILTGKISSGEPLSASDEKNKDRLLRSFVEPSFFSATQGTKRVFYPIDRAIRWAMTTFGGRQSDMFAASESDEGCMRWGMCDHETRPRA